MTSNAGTREMSTQSIGFGDKKYDTEDKGRKAVERFFSPEFRNRLDGIIHFNPLTEEIMKMVVDKFMKELSEQLAVKKISIKLSPEARTWLAQNGHEPRFGARPLTRLIQTEIKDILSDEILFGSLESGGDVMIDLENDQLTFEYSKSRVLVS